MNVRQKLRFQKSFRVLNILRVMLRDEMEVSQISVVYFISSKQLGAHYEK